MGSWPDRSLAYIRPASLAVDRETVPSDDTGECPAQLPVRASRIQDDRALLAAGLDPGIGMFHTDIDGRSSLALDAIEAARPRVDYWLLGYLASSAFANRDFTELSDGEVHLTHPLNSHLAYTAAQWRKVCQPIADWLAQSFFRAAGLGAVVTVDDCMIHVPQTIPPKPLEQGRKLDPLTPPLRSFIGPGCGHRQTRREGGFRDDPVPLMCWECGKALASGKIRFCSHECATAFSLAIHQTIDAGQPEGSKLPTHIAAKGERRSSGG
jgi:hypothetical protein